MSTIASAVDEKTKLLLLRDEIRRDELSFQIAERIALHAQISAELQDEIDALEDKLRWALPDQRSQLFSAINSLKAERRSRESHHQDKLHILRTQARELDASLEETRQLVL